MPFRKVQTQYEKVIDYQYIRNIKNKEVRKTRFKRTISQRIFRVLLILILACELGYLGFEGFQVLKGSHLFSLRNVQITGTQKTDPEEIRKIVLSGNSNTLLADLTQIKLRLESYPWIRSAVIRRELPGTLRVHIMERAPVALVLAGNLYLVDGAGRIIDTFDHSPEYSTLPVITGISNISNEAQIRRALEFVHALSSDRQILRQVSEIHPYDEYHTIIYLKGSSFGLLVSKDGMLPMIKKFISYSDFVKQNFTNQKLIDLRYQDQIILKDSYKEQL